MATVTIPVAATQQEIRCDAFICRNNLDVPESDPLNKYSAFIDRVAEPQDSTGGQVGIRQRLDPVRLDLAALMGESFTASGVTVTGAQLLALINAAIDAHKADGLTP